ncbi:MAG: hypothetical protein HZB98_03915 [Bacteroidia bacterium]|nr:hypothetical protein [Bacteroidia bacterium]
MEKIKIYKTGIIFMLSLVLFLTSMSAQNTTTSGIELLNAPVLFREGGKAFQQIVINCRSEKECKILIAYEGKTAVKDVLKKGMNKFLVTVPAVTKSKKITINVKIDDAAVAAYSINVVPPKKWDIYLVQHSHTDIGYTRPQSEILAEQMRYIDYALDYCDQTDNLPDES